MNVSVVNILCVAGGSAVGGVCRYLLSVALAGRMVQWPWATLAANLLGCLAIGLIVGVAGRGDVLSPQLRLLLTVGFCGGFTTFSTFVNENVAMLSAGHTLTMALYTAASVVGGLLLAYAGLRVGSGQL